MGKQGAGQHGQAQAWARNKALSLLPPRANSQRRRCCSIPTGRGLDRRGSFVEVEPQAVHVDPSPQYTH
jgi:hypothetical protein